jgi:hypothetical protein
MTQSGEEEIEDPDQRDDEKAEEKRTNVLTYDISF